MVLVIKIDFKTYGFSFKISKSLDISAYYLAKYSIAYLSVSKEYYKLNKLLRSNGKSKASFYSMFN